MNKKELILSLTEGFVLSYRDPLGNDILMDQAIKRVTLTSAFRKLDRIKQNGPTCLVYPGAVHTRLCHSLGVYYTGRQILLSVLENSNPEFTVSGMRSFLVACLLHDIGHFPYAHSLKELSIKEHEELAGEIILNDKELFDAVKNSGAAVEDVIAIIDDKKKATGEVEIYRHILSGALDPDKLDYLNRDAFFCGVPYGNQNNGYIISKLHILNNRIAIEHSAYASIEHILFSKYLMYKNIYWHKDVRSATCMIKKALLSAIRDKKIAVEDLYFIDDYDFDMIPQKYKEYEPLSLITAVRNNMLFERVWEREWYLDHELKELSSNIYSRFEAEDRIYKALKKRYPQLKEYEVIIDIPEPISFEADVAILENDGSYKKFSDVTKLFTKDVEQQFASSLRYIGIYTPDYVSRDIIKEVIDGREY